MEAPGINFRTARTTTRNSHIRALSLIIGPTPIYLFLRRARDSPRRRRQTSADDATLSLAQAEVSRGGRGRLFALRESIVQAPHSRRRTTTPAAAAIGDNDSGVLVLVIIIAGARAGPSRHADALAFVGDDHVA
jgi:hypothetical protein